MAGNTYAGKNLRIRVDGKTIFHATECSFTTSRNMESIASKDTNGEKVTPGNYSWGVSTNYLVSNKPTGSTTQIGMKEVLDIYQAGTEVQVQFTTDIVGDVIITGNTFIEGINMTAGTNGVATGDASLKGNGDFVTTNTIITILAPVITSGNSININKGQTLEYFITATNSPTNYSATGVFASGLNIDSTTGRIVGIPMTTGTFEISVNAENTAGTGSKVLTIVVAESTDVTPPTIPTNLTYDTNIVDPSNSALRKFTLHWDASADLESTVTGYDISINGAITYYTFAPGENPTSFVAGGKSPATTYLVKIKARNVFSNISSFSNEISVTTLS